MDIKEMGIKEKEQVLNYFLTKVVDGWMLNDLERLTAIPHRSGGAGNCNFPIALYTFACIEFLGQLTYSKSKIPKKGYTQTCITDYIDNFFPDEFKEKLQPHRNSFVDIFRHGLAHNYFAKAAGISRTKDEPFSVEGGLLVLDADRFAEAFKASIENLKSGIENDPKLIEKMVDRYDSQVTKHSKFKLPPATIKKFYSTPVSGASLPHPSMVKDLKTHTISTPNSSISKSTTTLPPELQKIDDES